jgi:hypothetical protein
VRVGAALRELGGRVELRLRLHLVSKRLLLRHHLRHRARRHHVRHRRQRLLLVRRDGERLRQRELFVRNRTRVLQRSEVRERELRVRPIHLPLGLLRREHLRALRLAERQRVR